MLEILVCRLYLNFLIFGGSLISAWLNWVKPHPYGGLLGKCSNTEGSEVVGNTIIERPSNDIPIHPCSTLVVASPLLCFLSLILCLKLNLRSDDPQHYSQFNILLCLLSSSNIIVTRCVPCPHRAYSQAGKQTCKWATMKCCKVYEQKCAAYNRKGV